MGMVASGHFKPAAHTGVRELIKASAYARAVHAYAIQNSIVPR